MDKVASDLELKLKNLPGNPGVYLFKDAGGKIVYIGKAKNLRHRVRSYFQSSGYCDAKTARLISRITELDIMETENSIEALILEANLVREYKPQYNVLLRDDKHFPYIKVTTNEPFPRVLVVRRLAKDGATYFGPYTSAKAMRKTIAFLTRLFSIRTCDLTIPHPKGKKQEVCLDYYIKRCGGPCAGLQTQQEYKELVDSLIMALSGKSQKLIDRLMAKMNSASDAMEFEEAARIRDQIEAIKSVMMKQNVDVGEMVDRDIVAIAREGRDAVAVVMQIRDGALIGRQDFQLSAHASDTDETVFETFLTQYYNHQPNLPQQIYLPIELPDQKLLQRWLRQVKGSKIVVATPKIGQKVKLIDLSARNARLLLDELLIQKRQQTERTSKMVTGLKDALKLTRSPRNIVCFDISNIGESDAVGSCVHFENARPKKSGYRHFKIKGVVGQDDYKMMREVIGRYFHRIKEEQTQPPDLVVVDGGKGQLSAAMAELKFIGFTEQPIIALAKRLEEVFLPNASNPITISRSSPALLLLKKVRDEAHRFAITYGRKVRTKRTIKSALDDIPGIGPAKRELLLKAFGSVNRIKQSSVEELTKIKGISPQLAETILGSLTQYPT
jgi:excinuclease ABC subunit C